MWRVIPGAMRPIQCLVITLACIVGSPLPLPACAGEKSDAKECAESAIPDSNTAEEIRAMPACKATVVDHAACYSVFRTATGKEFTIGGPAAAQEVVHFLGTLKDGQAYEFPSVFVDYQKTTPTYETAEQIRAMVPCKAKVEHVGVLDSRIATADGKMFFIGSPDAAREVIQFVQTLKVGQTYEFPRVFLEYQKKP